MREDEFVHNGLGCELEVIVPDEEHGAFAFFAEMLLAALCGVVSVRCVVDAPLERCAALAAILQSLAESGVPAVVLAILVLRDLVPLLGGLVVDVIGFRFVSHVRLLWICLNPQKPNRP